VEPRKTGETTDCVGPRDPVIDPDLQAEFLRGFFRAVSVLLRRDGYPSDAVKYLFSIGCGRVGAAEFADPEDTKLFTGFGMMNSPDDGGET